MDLDSLLGLISTVLCCAKETCLWYKRDLSIVQKRPVYSTKETYGIEAVGEVEKTLAFALSSLGHVEVEVVQPVCIREHILS